MYVEADGVFGPVAEMIANSFGDADGVLVPPVPPPLVVAVPAEDDEHPPAAPAMHSPTNASAPALYMTACLLLSAIFSSVPSHAIAEPAA